MKTTKHSSTVKSITKLFLLPFLLLAMSISFTSCEEEEDDAEYTGDPVWENQFYFGSTQVNDALIITHELETSNGHIKDRICYSDLPPNDITSWGLYLYIPTNDDLESGFEVNSVTLFYGGSSSIEIDEDNIFLGNQGSDNIDGVQYSIFSVDIQIPDNTINRDNFQSFHFAFDMIHRDYESGDEYNRDGKFVQVDIADCGGGGGGGDTSGYNCVSGDCEYTGVNAMYPNLTACMDACGGGGETEGEITFFTTSDLGCGTISVSVNGHGTETITQYYTEGVYECGLSGCANFTLPPGNYTFSASCGDYQWGPADFSITAGGCVRFELY